MENTLSRGSHDSLPNNERALSPAVLIAVALCVVALLTAVLTARLMGFDASAVPESAVLETRLLGFRDLPGGVVEVYDWESQEMLIRYPSGEGSFLRGVVRSLVRQRRGLDATAAPFQLTLLNDRRLILSDPETGEDISLNAFGPTNLAVFSDFIVAPNKAPMAPR